MVGKRAIVIPTQEREGEKNTATNALGKNRLLELKLWVRIVKLHYILLAPWIVYSISIQSNALQAALTVGIILAGLGGTILAQRKMVLAASLILLAVLVGGKVVTDFYKLNGPDTAILLSQFVAVIFLMEMTLPFVEYEREARLLQGRDDDLSRGILERVEKWLSHQLHMDARIGLASFLMSLGLLVVGSLGSVQVGQLALLAVFVLTAVIALLFLLTYQREPETQNSRIKS